jgi:hypothetical protein
MNVYRKYFFSGFKMVNDVYGLFSFKISSFFWFFGSVFLGSFYMLLLFKTVMLNLPPSPPFHLSTCFHEFILLHLNLKIYIFII